MDGHAMWGYPPGQEPEPTQDSAPQEGFSTSSNSPSCGRKKSSLKKRKTAASDKDLQEAKPLKIAKKKEKIDTKQGDLKEEKKEKSVLIGARAI